MSLEEVSNRNLVRYFMEELAKEGLGDISQRLRGRMRKLGILKPESGKKHGYRLVLSDYGRGLLEEMKK